MTSGARIAAGAFAGGLVGLACSALLGLRVLLSTHPPEVPVWRLVGVYLILGPATGALVGLLLPLGRKQAGAWLIGALAGAFLITASGAALGQMLAEELPWFLGFGAFGGGITGIVLRQAVRKGPDAVGPLS